MIRALAKGTVLWGFGRVPGGARLYRKLTRELMGTQATHVDKLRRVGPGYVSAWRDRCGLTLDGLDIWIHEAGWTPFWPMFNFLITGEAGVTTNVEGRVLDRYLSRAVNGALDAVKGETVCRTRRRQVEALRWMQRVDEAFSAIGATAHERVDPTALPLADESCDLCHSGGALEHYPPVELTGFLEECWRVLRPGGVASHVFDHRDHLHHADARLPFLAHLALPGPLYSLVAGHPLLYHGRLLPADVQRMFEVVGFERIGVRRLILPDRVFVDGCDTLRGAVGLPRAMLAPRFRHISDVDLRTAAAHYLYRKPA